MVLIVDHTLDKISHRRVIVVHDSAGSDPVRAHEDSLVHSGAKKIDRHEGRIAVGHASFVLLLAQEQRETVETRVAVCGHRISNYPT